MSIPVDIGVCEEHKYNKKGVCEHCRGCRFCDPPHDCSLKRNYIGYKMRCISLYAAQLLTNKDHSYVSESEKKWVILNRKTTFCGKDRIILIDNSTLCDDGKHLSNKDNLIKIRKFLGFEFNTCDDIPKSGWNMKNLETEGRSLLPSNKILR